jgi:hypothetical protein
MAVTQDAKPERLIPLSEGLALAGVGMCPVRSDWRERTGFPVVKIGGRLFVDPPAVRAWIETRREGAA